MAGSTFALDAIEPSDPAIDRVVIGLQVVRGAKGDLEGPRVAGRRVAGPPAAHRRLDQQSVQRVLRTGRRGGPLRAFRHSRSAIRKFISSCSTRSARYAIRATFSSNGQLIVDDAQAGRRRGRRRRRGARRVRRHARMAAQDSRLRLLPRRREDDQLARPTASPTPSASSTAARLAGRRAAAADAASTANSAGRCPTATGRCRFRT